MYRQFILCRCPIALWFKCDRCDFHKHICWKKPANGVVPYARFRIRRGLRGKTSVTNASVKLTAMRATVAIRSDASASFLTSPTISATTSRSRSSSTVAELKCRFRDEDPIRLVPCGSPKSRPVSCHRPEACERYSARDF